MIPKRDEKFRYLCNHQARVWMREYGMFTKRQVNSPDMVEQFWCCPIAWEKENQVLMPHSLHHAGKHDTKTDRSKYPYYIHSLLNLKAVHVRLHEEHRNWGKVSDYKAGEIERFLNFHPQAAAFVNELKPINYFKGVNND